MSRPLLAALWIASIACGRIAFDVADDAGFDALEPDAFDRCATDDVVLGPWGAAQRVDELSSAMLDEDPTPAFDDLEMFFVSNRAGNRDIYRATRPDTASPWGPPSVVTELAGPSAEYTIALSDDALTMWFGSDRPGGAGGDDIWTTTRTDRSSSWASPVNVTELNTIDLERGPTVFDEERAMVIHSMRPGGVGSNDLYLSIRGSRTEPWGPPSLLGAPNSAGGDQHAWVSPCGRWLAFHSNRSGPTALYEATRASSSEPFGAAVEITELNVATSVDNDLRMLADRRRAYFTSDRDGDLNLYVVTR